MAVLEQETQRNKYVTFSVDKEDFGIPIYYVNDILRNQTITQVPSVPEYIKGITSLRGIIVPVVDVRLRFRKSEAEYNDRTCIIVTEFESLIVGLVVDKVKEVILIDENDILQPPSSKMGYHNKYVKNVGRVGESVNLILDLEKLIKENYMDI